MICPIAEQILSKQIYESRRGFLGHFVETRDTTQLKGPIVSSIFCSLLCLQICYPFVVLPSPLDGRNYGADCSSEELERALRCVVVILLRCRAARFDARCL